MDYSGFSPADEARVRRLVEAMPGEHTQHIRTVRYGASGRNHLADAASGTCTIYDSGLALDDASLSGIIAHENHHCGHGINEHAACAAQADYLEAAGHHAHARVARNFARSQEYQEATRRAYGGTLPAGAFDEPTTPQDTSDPQHQPAEAQQMTRRQREQARGAAVWAAVFGGRSPAPHQAAQVEPSAPQPQQAEQKPMTRRQREQERGAAVLRAVFGGKS